MEKKGFHRFLRQFAVLCAALLIGCAFFVILFDPFYHYHGPLPGLKAVVTKSEYQCIGTIRNFSYDSVLCGSSTAENYNNRWFDELFGARTVKAIKSSGTTADLCYYLDEAFSTHEIRQVFYSLDLFALDGDPKVNFVNDAMPLYLYDKNPFNDVKYLWNKDVIFEDIPYLLAMNLAGYEEGTSYNWWEDKTFSRQEALRHYVRLETVADPVPEAEYKPRVDGNLDLLTQRIQAHPETRFYFLLPPYSMLWWDNAYRSGMLEEYFYARREALERLTVFENVRVLDFQSEESIILDLDHYMDPVHFSVDINRLLATETADENSRYLVRDGEVESRLLEMEELAEKICTKETENIFSNR